MEIYGFIKVFQQSNWNAHVDRFEMNLGSSLHPINPSFAQQSLQDDT
jgi:hypothetical protein